MPHKLSQSSTLSTKTGKTASQKRTTLRLEPSTANTKRINPMTAFVNASAPRTTSSSSSKSKGKGKEVVKDLSPVVVNQEINQQESYQLWADLYEPKSEAELAVHVRKVDDVRNWLREAFEGGPSGKLRKYRRLLVLTGPAGTAKSSTIRVLSNEMGFEILDWKSPAGDAFANADLDGISSDPWVSDETSFTKFRLFLERASRCQNVFRTTSTLTTSTPSASSSSSPSSNSNSNLVPQRRIILLEDLPNILHASIRSQFHEAIRSLVENADPDPVPIIIIISDSGMRGEAGDERLASGAWGRDQDGAVDIRNVLPKDVLHGPYVREIKFNPIAPTLLKKALQALLKRHFASSSRKSPITGQMLDTVVNSANGDIRSAIMALQFACIRHGSGRKSKGADSSQVLVESITRREQSLALFHLMGKVLYNKRKGDPPPPSASAKDITRDQELDKTLRDPPALPTYLSEHDRKASRVDVNTIYADSPIDSSLFSLYLHHNYTQFCGDVDECDGVAEWLSWADSSGGEAWYQINPYQFHLLALGTLHSLPTPVPRLSQRVCKPVFFENLNKEKKGWEGVRDVRSWIIDQNSSGSDDSGWNLSTWTPTAIATELGGVFRARDVAINQNLGLSTSRRMPSIPSIPSTHQTFSHLKFVYPKSDNRRSLGGQALDEEDADALSSDGAMIEEQQEMGMWQDGVSNNGGIGDPERRVSVADAGGWLESDDIEDF
ncbi:Rad17 cell cycle checkpoint protein-domain-containing protein [Lentinula raphanica]|nr:Rad17 cell cycle checkpoint protein-domain-containing protein [Lentinula raphanica]